ncbi:MAG: tRNA uridine-5-carboxymethylaminomethyl(34) synthesis enzyme MnmG [Rikenellaceae bacterium]|nr:tRNA uridine-5-carboxymethylaminomethyl(34) synthesis enzyme MnmG [Rikenellaceae bacterium]
MRTEYDIIVVGGGHAGCEAAAAAANMGSRTLLITMDMSKFASMSCNPAVGGVAKGQIVREIDALGGQMGRITDLTTIQFRMLNRSKGAAMWSPRAQCDKAEFSAEWRRTLENTWRLYLWQDCVTELIFEGEIIDNKQVTNEQATVAATRPRVVGVRTQMGVEFRARAVVLTAGTFLEGVMHCGLNRAEGGRAGDAASHGVTASLVKMGFEVDRMKTGTPVRLDARTIDFDALEAQYGDTEPSKFSFMPDTEPVKNQLPCFLVYTTPEVHEELRKGFDRSPMFTGVIQGRGPRYCPSIEDKLRTFADKEQHQLFLEPEGRNTNEYYLNGFSSSLPFEVQVAALQKIKGLEDVHIYRPGYAIEYDYFPPTQLHHTLETKLVDNLYFAGQINGTTGYEEAAAQGLMAGINAHLKLAGKEPFILRRDEAYIGVLIDDLVTKGVDEPYRMFTSRAEHRILLRQDNADIRLTQKGFEIGLVPPKRMAICEEKKTRVESLINYLRGRSITPSEIQDYLISVDQTPLTQGRKLFDLVLRNNVTILGLADHFPKLARYIEREGTTPEEIEEAEIQVKYRGYIEREKYIADKLRRLEDIAIPDDFDYHSLQSLTIEARQKLTKIRPTTIGQASRISGVSPADINVLLVYFGR